MDAGAALAAAVLAGVMHQQNRDAFGAQVGQPAFDRGKGCTVFAGRTRPCGKVVHDHQTAVVGQHGFDERLIVLVVDVADNMTESIPANDVEVLFHHLPARRLTVTVADLAQTFLQGAAVHLAVEVDDNIADATAPRLQVLTARN